VLQTAWASLFNGIHRLHKLAWLTTTVRREFGLTASRRRNYDG
jgi:hypothetical protein